MSVLLQKFMSSSIAVSAFALLLLLASAAQEKPYRGPSEKDVIVLDPANFEDTVYSSPDPWLIELYAPWCQHCVTMRPEWAQLATNLKGVIKVAKMDPSDNAFRPKFNKLYGLIGFPRIVMIPAGVKSQAVYDVYEGARDASSMEEWARERMRAHKALAVEQITTPQIWRENCLQAGATVCIVTVLPTLLDSSQEERSVYLQIVRTVANNFRERPVAFLWAEAGNHPEFQSLFNLNSGFPAVILINHERRVFTIMKSSLTEQKFQEWLEEVFRSRGGRRFSRYSKDITFSTVTASAPPQPEEQFSAEEL